MTLLSKNLLFFLYLHNIFSLKVFVESNNNFTICKKNFQCSNGKKNVFISVIFPYKFIKFFEKFNFSVDQPRTQSQKLAIHVDVIYQQRAPSKNQAKYGYTEAFSIKH